MLVQDPRPIVKDGHRLIEVARRFSSFVALRTAHPDYQDYNETFLIVDETGLLHRRIADRYEGTVHFTAPRLARERLAFFNEVWERSEADPELLRLHL
jgi:hypothetical protein